MRKEEASRSRSRGSRRPQQSPAPAPPPEGEGQRLPPRRIKHPSNKQQTARWFYNTLILLFLALASGLFFFGQRLIGD